MVWMLAYVSTIQSHIVYMLGLYYDIIEIGTALGFLLLLLLKACFFLQLVIWTYDLVMASAYIVGNEKPKEKRA